MRHRLFIIFPFGLIFSQFISCSSENSIGESGRPLRVFAAASLTSVMPAVAEAFQKKFEEAKVEFNFAASSILAKQIERGAQALIELVPPNFRPKGGFPGMNSASLSGSSLLDTLINPQPKGAGPEEHPGYKDDQRQDMQQLIETQQ